MLVDRATRRRLCRARDLLVAEATPVARIAAIVGISPFHFIRLFDAVFGETPHQYRTRTRLERAKELLAAGGSVTDVCFEVGFSSVGSFSRLFARRVGMSPSTYRRRARGADLHPGCLPLMALGFRNFREAPAAPAVHAAGPC